MARVKIVVALGMGALLFAAVGQTQEKKIAMTPVNYEGLKQEVLMHRGKVLVVDFWGSFCRPCKTEGFPHMMEMHKKFAGQGLAVVTVSIDDHEDQAAVDSANQFLNKTNAPFRHVHLTDPDWQKRFGIKSVPCYYVFDRAGRWVRFGGDDGGADHAALDKTVAGMLEEK